jgi:hypothetical protein
MCSASPSLLTRCFSILKARRFVNQQIFFVQHALAQQALAWLLAGITNTLPRTSRSLSS